MPVPLLLDTDIGDDVDDIFAVLLAALEPQVLLLGITTVFGDVQQRARIARKVLDLAGRSEVPVAAGIGPTLSGHDPTRPMQSARGFVAPPGTDEWTELGRRLEPVDGVEFLIERIRSAPEPPVLAAIGPLTNAGAALRRAPDLARKVRALVLMGGRLDREARRGEHNFSSDAEATAIVLGSGAPLYVGTWEVTRLAVLGDPDLPRLRAGTAACRAAADQLELYCREYRKRDVTPMYDPLTLTAAYTGRYLSLAPLALTWHTDVAPGARAYLGVAGGAPPNAQVSVDLDSGRFREYLLTTIGAPAHPTT